MASENDGPKLYSTKPKKSQLKKATPAPNPTATTMDPVPPPPTPPSSGVPPQSQSFARRYKFVWPVLLTVNLAIGGYLFLRTNKKDKSEEDSEVAAMIHSTPSTNTTPTPAAASTTGSATVTAASAVETPTTIPPIVPVKVREPIPEDKQREIFKWILEEKRKIKPNDPEEKKQLDEDKAILKQFIKAKSVPSF